MPSIGFSQDDIVLQYISTPGFGISLKRPNLIILVPGIRGEVV